jgi:hypothetical protein
MPRSLALGTALALSLVFARPAAADEQARAPAPVPAGAAATPEGLLAAADAAIGNGNLPLAHALFLRLTTEYPETREASEARRALAILAVKAAPTARASTPPPPGAPPDAPYAAEDGDIVNRDEPYSKRTSERLRLSIWEKVDFSVTAFLYGMSVGFSFALSQDTHNGSDVLAPVAVGAIVYTLGSVAFLKTANPDRGDLPLALAITSYAPTTTLLLISALDPHAKSTTASAATAAAGVLSIPVAIVAARNLQLDPGDTQLVRDAGFWGLALSTVGMLGFGGGTSDYGSYRAPSGQKVAVASLVGLYGGLGLGLLGASASEVSLERVRVTTWGGYGGAMVGLLLGASTSNSGAGTYRGTVIGAALGLGITFLSTGSLDGIPPPESQPQAWHRRLAPTLVQVSDREGRLHPGLGVGGVLF